MGGLGRGCVEGATGFVCSTCIPDYYVAPDRSCKACPPGAGGTVFAAFLLLSLAAAAWTLVQFFASTFSWELVFARQTGVNALAVENMARRIRAPPSLRLTVVVFQSFGLLTSAHFLNFDASLFAIECTIPSWPTRYALSVL